MPNALGRSGLAVVAALVLAIALVTLAQSRSKADPLMVFDGVASPIAELPVQIDAGELVTFETVAVSPGADPVLHLLDRTGHQVAVDDNGGTGSAARLVYRSSVDGDYMLVLRARTSTSSGTADVLLNGSLWRSDITFAGWQLELDALRDRETVQAVRVPNGAGPVLELYLLQKSGLGIARRATGGGIAASLYFATGPGTRIVLLGSSRTEGPARLFRNDSGIFGHDNDLDGLGKELEAGLETCSATTDVVLGIRCDRLADPRDTDGDGLSDGAETLGLRVGNEFLLLPLWGANPRHKDLFIEVDFSRRSKEDNAQKVDMKMSPEMARDFAAAYGDMATTDGYLRASHAATLRNPDGLSGISVHLDTGVPPASAGDATIYGNWGGHNAVDAVKDDDEWKGVDYEDAWKEEMTVGRRGIFHHALAYATGGGQTAPGFAATYSVESASIAVHETGHSLGLGHSGPYGIDVDVNCKPNYPSVMNYAYDDTLMFADGRNSVGPALNNWELRESYAVSPRATALLDALEHRFEYYVDREHGHVDWNRDGQFASEGETVRAYANYRPGGTGCEYTRWNKSRVDSATSPLAPALARMDGRLRIFYIDKGDRALWWVTSSKSAFSCPEPAVRECAGAGWNSPRLLLKAEVSGVDAIQLREEDALLVVATDAAGGIWERTIRPGDWGSWARIPGPVTVGAPALAYVFDEIMLATRDEAGGYRYRIRSAGGAWQGSQPFRSVSGEFLGANENSTFSPAMIEAPLEWDGRNWGLFALLADEEDDLLDLWYWDPDSGLFQKTDLLEERDGTRPGPVSGRPAMAVAGNRLYVVYRQRESHEAKFLMSYIKVLHSGIFPQREQRVGLLGQLDNVWATIQGADLLYEPGIDQNLRAVLTHGKERGSKYEVWFYPKADGIQDYRYINYNDWEVLRVNLCREVVDPGGTVSNPIRCLPKTW